MAGRWPVTLLEHSKAKLIITSQVLAVSHAAEIWTVLATSKVAEITYLRQILQDATSDGKCMSPVHSLSLTSHRCFFYRNVVGRERRGDSVPHFFLKRNTLLTFQFSFSSRFRHFFLALHPCCLLSHNT